MSWEKRPALFSFAGAAAKVGSIRKKSPKGTDLLLLHSTPVFLSLVSSCLFSSPFFAMAADTISPSSSLASMEAEAGGSGGGLKQVLDLSHKMSEASVEVEVKCSPPPSPEAGAKLEERPLDFSSNSGGDAAAAAAAAAALAAVRKAGTAAGLLDNRRVSPPPPSAVAAAPPFPDVGPYSKTPLGLPPGAAGSIFNLNAAVAAAATAQSSSKSDIAAVPSSPSSACPSPVTTAEGMQRLQRLIKANQALALSKMQAAAASKASSTFSPIAAAAITTSPPPLPPPPAPSVLAAIPPPPVGLAAVAGLHAGPEAGLAAAAAAAAAAVPPPPPAQNPSELQRVNHESLQQYNHFRETMLRQITLAKMKRRRRSDSPGKAAAAAVAAATAAATAANCGGGSACNSANTSAGSPMNMSEDEKSMTVSAPCSPASSLDTSPELQMINSCARPSLAALSSNTPVSSAAAAAASKRKREEIKDEAYWERRKKNNEAAKRSRDARRAKEDEIAIRAAFLEQENIQLKWEVATLKTETCRLKALLLNDSALDRIGTSGSAAAAAAAAAAAVAASSSAPASPERH